MVYYSPDRYNDDMFLVGMLGWWYSGGWKHRVQAAGQGIKDVAAFFSVGQLLQTLFSPFRQISAGHVNGSIGAQLQALLDKTVSRVVGAIVRTITILAGIVVILAACVYQLIILVVWLLLPLFPIIGLILAVIGWVPKWQ